MSSYLDGGIDVQHKRPGDRSEKEKLIAELKSVGDDSVGSDQVDEEEQFMRNIWEKFNEIYDNDPALRKLIPEEEAKEMSLEEKYHIINAYMRSGGIQGLIGEEDDDMKGLSEEEKKMVEDEFA
jgi:hypothetical protein